MIVFISVKKHQLHGREDGNDQRRWWLRDLLSLTSVEHASVDEVRAHDGGLDAVLPCRQQLQTHRLCETYRSELAGTVVCRRVRRFVSYQESQRSGQAPVQTEHI